LTVATLVSVLLVRQVLMVQLDDRIDAALVQESRELSRLAREGIDPDTGEPFGDDVARILEVFLQRNVPARNEIFLMFVDGELYLRSRNEAPYRLDREPELMARWSDIDGTDAGTVETGGGTVRYLAVPVTGGSQRDGVFVAAIFRELEAQEIGSAVQGAALVGLASVLIGSFLAWRLSRRIIDPVEAVRASARAISETDLSRRVDVRGDDEIARLAETFNDLLDRLEAAFRSQRAFVDEAGHELRTPITIVRGQLELLSDDPEQRARAVSLATGELDRMSRMVNDLLLLAKAEQPEFLTFDLVDLEALTRDVAEKAHTLADRRWDVEAVADGAIVGDGQRLEQAMIQLVQNAVDHTDTQDEVAVGSSIEGETARLWVRDTGPGIPPELLDHIFDRFSRGGATRTEGAGLGLAIVRAIAEAHGGTVEVASEVGSGTTFTLLVPVDQRPVVEDVA
jgi:signal transduction histidine kinase